MAFYDLTKHERARKVETVHNKLLDFLKGARRTSFPFFSNDDTYIRKAAYQAIGKIHKAHPELGDRIISALNKSLEHPNEKVRQTTVNAAGEIGMRNFDLVASFFDKGLFDEHHSVRNAVIGSMKKVGEKNPSPLLTWARKYLHHPDKEIRREICHGIELRGRTHPEDILPLLKELQHDKTARVKNTLVHVIGQISYKKDCLATVIEHLRQWPNKDLVKKAIEEIISVHHRYRNFSALTQSEAKQYIRKKKTVLKY